jgi:hypothetical protein
MLACACMHRVLYDLGVMSEVSGGGSRITPEGYSFLLHDVPTQLWLFVRAYIEKSDDVAELLIFLFQISFLRMGDDYCADQLTDAQKRFKEELFHIGVVWRRKSSARRFYATCFALHMVTTAGGSSGGGGGGSSASVAAATSSLATTGALAAAATTAAGGGSGGGGELECGLIVESNFRVYAYTASEHVVLLLNLFVRVEYVFVNLAVGTITKESVGAAFKRGISAEQVRASPRTRPRHHVHARTHACTHHRARCSRKERASGMRMATLAQTPPVCVTLCTCARAQLVRFLSSHAHERVRDNSAGPVPDTVVDQIRLWEEELPHKRVRSAAGVLLSDVFDGAGGGELFRQLEQRASDMGALLWSSSSSSASSSSSSGAAMGGAPSQQPQQRCLVVEADAVTALQDFFKRSLRGGGR